MIERMRVEDIDEVLKIENDVFSSPWKRDFFEYELNENDLSSLFVLRENGEIISYGGMWCLFENCDITTIATRRDKWHMGYGQKMMDQLIATAKENECEFMHLEVRVSNKKAIDFYEKNGFVIVRTRVGYYDDNNEDAYDMIKGLI